MKKKAWLAILAAALAVGIGIWLLIPKEEAALVEVWSEGELLYSLRLDVDQSIDITSGYGTNTVTIQDGHVAITHADCPDQECVAAGWHADGNPIVCLPNHLLLKFAQNQIVDGAVG